VVAADPLKRAFTRRPDRPRLGRSPTRVTRVSAVVLVAGAGLAFAGGAAAKTKHHPLRCRAGYARRMIRVPVREHGQIVRRHGRIVYTRVQRCVRVTRKPPAGGSRPVVPPTSPTQPSTPPPPAATVPVNTVAPAISGNPTQGSTLSASQGTWTNGPTSFAYQWQRCNALGGSCQSIIGATGSTYGLGSADVGSTVRVSVAASNSSGSASAPSSAAGPIGSPSDPVVVAMGDIACPAGDMTHSCQQSATATLAQTFHPQSVMVLGDNQYDSGSLTEYDSAGAYNNTWGVFNPIVHPVPGNHEYGTSGAAGYFQYFGQSIANPDSTPNGYYSFNLGTWHIVALNSDCSDSGCADAVNGTTSSAQTAWLQSDLAANHSACVLAMWHAPLFSWGWTLGSPGVAPLWQALYNAHADVVLDGHDHLYERYAQQDPSGNATTNGIREFVVGTGGESLNGLSANPPAALQASDQAFGVLVLTLHAGSYSWKFVTTSGTTADSGTTACHGPGAAPAAVAAVHAARLARVARLSGPALAFDARPLSAWPSSMRGGGLPVAVHCSRACDVAVTIWLRHGRRLRRVASAYETESQIPGPYSRILVRVPARWLKHPAGDSLVMRFAALDAAGHRRTVTRTVHPR